ncbi:imidazole glycerol phosphate synthase cyclase subunit [Pelagibacteraceae bacterium]|nr:imidazole glycerol phosphate synthase cyclase subunit [Pelagibacteraceae bacterium]
MYKPRLIARLDIKNENLIKGIHLEGLRKIGDPNKFAVKYYKEGVDEILLMDCVASLYGRNSLIDVIKRSAKNIFIPITVGGGIRNINDAENLLKNGADKICVNTAAIKNPKLITKLAERFGSQCVVLSIEAKKIKENYWEAYTHNGREKTGLNVIDWIKKSTSLGVGEVILTSVDKEGTCTGFDYDLCSQVSSISKVPFIISGGLGKTEHINYLLNKTYVDGLAAASVLHYNKLKIKEIQKNLKKK